MRLELQAGMTVRGRGLLVIGLAERVVGRDVECGGQVALRWGDGPRELLSGDRWRRADGAAMAALGPERLLIGLRGNGQ